MLARRSLLLSTRPVLAPALAAVLAAVPALGACDFDVPPANTYVVSRVSLPSSPPEAEAFGMDLDGDGEVDNRLGRALAVLSSQGIELETALASAIDRGSLILLVNLRTASFSSADDARAEVRLGDPATAMPSACAGPGDAICRRHLDGTGTFQLKPGAPEEAALLGTIRGGTFQGGPGRVSLELALGGPLAIPFQLLGARARATGIEEAGIDRVVVAGGLTMERLHRDVIPAIRDRVQALVRASCPGTSPPGCGVLVRAVDEPRAPEPVRLGACGLQRQRGRDHRPRPGPRPPRLGCERRWRAVPLGRPRGRGGRGPLLGRLPITAARDEIERSLRQQHVIAPQ